MYKAKKIKIYPTREQAVLIDKTIGCSRFVYNNALAFKKLQYEKDGTNISIYDLMKGIATLKQEFEWLKEVEYAVLQQSLWDLDKAYKAFFRDKKGFPQFHKKGRKDAYRTLKARVSTRHSIKIPKIGAVKTAEKISKWLNIRNATISKQAGQYFISLLVEYTPQPYKKLVNEVGIDVGIKNFATLSDGVIVDNIRTTVKYADRLAREQRRLSKMQKGSHNREKQKVKVARLHLRIANIRSDFLHKVSTVIAKQYSLVAVEDLNIEGMLANHKLAKSISDCSWGEFIRQLEYKGLWYGCEVKKIGRFDPSSKLCNECGYKMEEMPLNIRDWECPQCHTWHNRDINAAKNILKLALSGRQEEVVDTCNIGYIERQNLGVAA
jgi:putative transposase